MGVTWVLKTHSDPLAAVRQFLWLVWERAGLDGMILPVYQTGDLQAAPGLIDRPDLLAVADPFIPLVPVNTSRLVAQMAGKSPQARYGALLRSCEARALMHVAERDGLNLDEWLTISVDCLSSFSPEDYQWRVEKAGGAEQLTRQALRFARQGGIAPYRYRAACQMCESPFAPQADLSLQVLGLPAREFFMVSARDNALSDRLGLRDFTDGLAPDFLLTQRQHLADQLRERHAATRQNALQGVPSGVPLEPDVFLSYLSACAPCQSCLEVCPVYDGELVAYGDGFPAQAMLWLASCVKCGMCEQACPRRLPLTAVHANLCGELV
jgi:formate dehydrogenase subunit beta